ncbi:hypothetical protein LF912_03125 [Bifidobacterium longum]|uniref:hypothetical protein n=1 Tax=Bifidobacterium longum TaxID=216816 RepID=UPI001F0D1FDF|nr:hypothetical protein [Bifidobacterium longum]MCH4845703.1 hypothetical protein [Bifidobacterium longum]
MASWSWADYEDRDAIVHVTDDRRIVVDAGGHIAVGPSAEAVDVEVQVDSVAAQHDLPANAELLGVASANPITVDELADNTCATYFGRAQAIWRIPAETSGIACSTNALMPSS